MSEASRRPPARWVARQLFSVFYFVVVGVALLAIAASRGADWWSFGLGVAGGVAIGGGLIYSKWKSGELFIRDPAKVAETREKWQRRMPLWIGLGVGVSGLAALLARDLLAFILAVGGALLTVAGVHLVDHLRRNWREIYEISLTMDGKPKP